MDHLGIELRSRPPHEHLSSNASYSDRESPRKEENPKTKDVPPELQEPPRTLQTLYQTQQSPIVRLRFASRWLISLTFAALILATLKIYEQKRNFSSNEKTTFSTVITALILGLGLNIFVSTISLKTGAYDDVHEADDTAGGVQRISQSPAMEGSSG